MGAKFSGVEIYFLKPTAVNEKLKRLLDQSINNKQLIPIRYFMDNKAAPGQIHRIYLSKVQAGFFN